MDPLPRFSALLPSRAACAAIVFLLAAASATFGMPASGPSVTPLPAIETGPASGPLLPVALSPLENRLFADAADGRLDNHSLLAAALVAGGASSPEEIERRERRLDALTLPLRESAAVLTPPKARAQAVFEFMHLRILRSGYRVDATDVASALDTGQFNCVSASVLFCCLAEQFGLDARGVELPGHAMSRLYVDGQPIEVETTCPKWFRLTDDPRKRAELVAKAAGWRGGARGGPIDCREVSGVALVATIYYNRGVDLLFQKRFAEAVEANVKALWLDPSSDTARGNLLATLNNWAIDEAVYGRYNEAVGLLRSGMALKADFQAFRANYVHVHRQWVETLCRQGRFDESRGVLLAARRDAPDEPWFDRTLVELRQRQAATPPADGPHAVLAQQGGSAGQPDGPLTTLWPGQYWVSDKAEGAMPEANGTAL
jgi:tetratricopeptide (TPR) repeat protein